MLDWFNNKDIAVVGNACSLFDCTHGNEIDQHSVVCRLNRGVIIADPVSQGQKTTVWAYAEERIVDDLFDSTERCYTMHLSLKFRKCRLPGHKKKSWEAHPETDFYYPMDNLDQLIHNFGHNKPSSGLILLDWISRCSPESVTIYGFDWKKTPTWYRKESSTEHIWELEENYIKNNILILNNFKLIQ